MCLKPLKTSLLALALALAVGPAFADGIANELISRSLAPPAAPGVTIFTAKKVLTMERSNPEATAVAVSGKRIVAVGSLPEVKAALRAVTIEAAYSWQKENELGSIAPGKIANFTVLEENPLTVEPMKLKDVPIWGTVFEGRLFPITQARKTAAIETPSATFTPENSIAGMFRVRTPAGVSCECGACGFNRLLARGGILKELNLALPVAQ